MLYLWEKNLKRILKFYKTINYWNVKNHCYYTVKIE